MSMIQLSVVAFLISTLLLILFFTKKTIKTLETTIYGNMLIVNFLFSLFSIIIIIYALSGGDNTYIGLLQKVYLSLMVFLSFLILIYNFSIIGVTTKKFNSILFSINFLGMLSIVITEMNVINTGTVLDGYGLSYNISIALTIIYFLLITATTIIIFIKNQDKFKKDIPFIILIIMFVFGLTLRHYYPSLIFETFLFAFMLLIMYFTIENPDLKMLNELELAKENTDRANEAKTEFLSNMSHEIRTPLNAIVGFSNSILEDKTLSDAKAEAKDIIMASNNLLEIVNGILDISKIEAGKMEIVETEYKLLEVLNNITKLIIPRIGEKPIKLKTNFSKDIPTILYGDMSKVREIITNLLTNAVKYTEKGIIELSIQCINTKNKCKLIISVEDTGRGIKQDKIDKLFTKFNRLEEDKNTTLEGTGLGLAITKKLVEMLGGKIVVQSKYGSGSKFTVYLEQKIIKMIEEKQPIKETKTTEQTNYSNKKILIVDDNMLNIKVASRILKNYQITPDTVLSGQECLDKVKEITYDLIFMDDMMPNMSGPETLKILKDALPATDEDYKTEFLDYIISVKVVKDFNEAIEHIRKYSTGHSECIITQNYANAEKFVNEIDSAALYINASTRFTDGGEFGMGAEIGISTGKLHARGPMGIKDLTTVKYVVRGNGQIR